MTRAVLLLLLLAATSAIAGTFTVFLSADTVSATGVNTVTTVTNGGAGSIPCPPGETIFYTTNGQDTFCQ
jgi:hypothetical protein